MVMFVLPSSYNPILTFVRSVTTSCVNPRSERSCFSRSPIDRNKVLFVCFTWSFFANNWQKRQILFLWFHRCVDFFTLFAQAYSIYAAGCVPTHAMQFLGRCPVCRCCAVWRDPLQPDISEFPDIKKRKDQLFPHIVPFELLFRRIFYRCEKLVEG